MNMELLNQIKNTTATNLSKSDWSVSYNLILDKSPPFGHSFLTINHHERLASGTEQISIASVIGFVGGLESKDFFGLLTSRSKVKDESVRIQSAQNIYQCSWKISLDQLAVLLSQVNHDRRLGGKGFKKLLVPDPNKPDNELTAKEQELRKRYKNRNTIKDPETGAYLADNPGGPRFSILFHNCKKYGVNLLKKIGIDEPFLNDIFIKIPIFGKKLKHVTIIDNSAIETMKWDPKEFYSGLISYTPYRKRSYYFWKKVHHNIENLKGTIKGLGLKNLLLFLLCANLVATSSSIILGVLFKTGLLPSAAWVLALVGSNVVLAALATTALLSIGIYGCLKNFDKLKHHWLDVKNLFFPESNHSSINEIEMQEVTIIHKKDPVTNPSYDTCNKSQEIFCDAPRPSIAVH